MGGLRLSSWVFTAKQGEHREGGICGSSRSQSTSPAKRGGRPRSVQRTPRNSRASINEKEDGQSRSGASAGPFDVRISDATAIGSASSGPSTAAVCTVQASSFSSNPTLTGFGCGARLSPGCQVWVSFPLDILRPLPLALAGARLTSHSAPFLVLKPKASTTGVLSPQTCEHITATVTMTKHHPSDDRRTRAGEALRAAKPTILRGAAEDIRCPRRNFCYSVLADRSASVTLGQQKTSPTPTD
ncbi:hypothetical protein V8E36_000734 [Tilletia maclaganii]